MREFGEVVEEAEAGVADLVAADAELAPERLPRMVMGMGSTCPERAIPREGIDDRAGALVQVEVVEVVGAYFVPADGLPVTRFGVPGSALVGGAGLGVVIPRCLSRQ
ncbi:hypothetical protein [Streptomyces sp. LUP47B]|uniref:hypothetical protein n=1 Tax=unclassified Streptomyces TaxID=2593676 RepID=UPI000851C081|nr:hypothetical protein [Streptomyces sp. LUP47B]